MTVHAEDGSRIACGLLESIPGKDNLLVADLQPLTNVGGGGVVVPINDGQCRICTSDSVQLGYGLYKIVNNVCTAECVDGMNISSRQDEGWRCGSCPTP